jgi:hypothetical protein
MSRQAGYRARLEGKEQTPPESLNRKLVSLWKEGWQLADQDCRRPVPEFAVGTQYRLTFGDENERLDEGSIWFGVVSELREGHVVFDPAWPEGMDRSKNEEVVEMFRQDGVWWDEDGLFYIVKAEVLCDPV